MAGYRQFHTKFWKDEWVIGLEIEERYLYSYLFTNELSSISGIYQIPLKVICNETDLPIDFIRSALKKFQDDKKIYYKDGVMWVVNMRKHHTNASPRTMVKVNNDISDIPDGDVKRAYLYYTETGIYHIDTVPILNTESVSVSVIKSVSASASASEPEQNAAAAAPFPIVNSSQTGDSFYIRVWSKVTGMAAIPGGDFPKVLTALEALRSQHPQEDELISYLKKYYSDWLKRKTKNGIPYSRTNCAWIYDLAVAGEPTKDEIQNRPKPRADPNCPKCDGTGWMSSGIDDIHDENFGRLVQCDCMKVRG